MHSEINRCIYDQLVFHKVAISTNGEKYQVIISNIHRFQVNFLFDSCHAMCEQK